MLSCYIRKVFIPTFNNMMYKSIIRPVLFRIDPENVHELLFSGLKTYKYLTPARSVCRNNYCNRQEIHIRNMMLKSRIGLAAGFDKAAEVYDELADFGFGFIEIGTVTPHSQSGNPKPRIFRLIEDDSLISRTGFNNPGTDIIAERLKAHNKRNYILGANINRDASSIDIQIVSDFLYSFNKLYDLVDYFTINWGSIEPNDFTHVCQALQAERMQKNVHKNIFIKLPADISTEVLDHVIDLARTYGIDGFIATGPTMDRSLLTHLSKDESDKLGAGGVSGKGIGEKSRKIIGYLSQKTNDEFILIGAGGIMTPDDAEAMIKAGADLIQIYSAFIYSGPGIVNAMNKRIEKKEIIR